MAKAAPKKPAEAATVAEAETTVKKSSAVGPRDGMKAFNRIKSILEKLDPDVRLKVKKAIEPIGDLSDDEPVEDGF